MFRFENPEKLWLLCLVPILAFFLVWAWQKKKAALQLFGNTALLNVSDISDSLQKRRMVMLCAAIALLIVAWANPQQSGNQEAVKQQSADIFLALDLSNSMLAEDTRPNRLEKAKHFAARLTGALAGNRIGLIIFAGRAFLQMPLTTDYATAQIFIQSADPSLMPIQGTAIGEAIDIALKNVMSQKEPRPAALIVISDGEDHDKNAEAIAKQAVKSGLSISTVGVGTAEGGLIPEGHGGFKQDDDGKTVKSALNEAALKAIAASGNGIYTNIEEEDTAIKQVTKATATLEKRETQLRSFTNYQSYFQYPLLLGMSLLLLDLIYFNYIMKRNTVLKH
jgi:Ca-activated chloride channel family protein